MAKYRVTQETLDDIKSYQTLPIERYGIFLKNSLVAQNIYDYSMVSENKELANNMIDTLVPPSPSPINEKRVENLCHQITKYLAECKIEYGVMTAPSMMVFVENDDNPQLVSPIAIVAKTYKVTMDEFKALCQFIYASKKCLWLYQVTVNAVCKENQMLLRLSLLTRNAVPTFAEFEVDNSLPLTQ